ncbi:hypothetical protein F4802DRAFT_264790 [Xylaria palmicola]|nr:hypothetical protein F4802DRAFT_264790 [Xylaria palmicola]
MDPYASAASAMSQPQPPLPPHQQSPRGVALEDGPNSHRRNNSHFGSHDDFYAFLDNNRGPSMASAGLPNGGPSGPAGPSERSPPPAPMPPQQQNPHQRNLPSQSRPPVTNLFTDRSRPPSYSGSRSEELLVDKNANAKIARQNQRRGPPVKTQPVPRQRTTSPTPPVSGGSSPTHPHSSRPVSGAGERENATGSGPVPRLKSPSVLECVLQPLEQKVREYDQLMRREQEEIRHLDEELRVLQARRAEAEARFDEAKSKHDEYRRQYTDVERAMSGELPVSPRPPQQQQQQQRPATMQGLQQRPMSARRLGDDGDGDDFDDDDEDFSVPPFGPGRRINSQQSFGRASQKTGGKERFRFSNLFSSSR